MQMVLKATDQRGKVPWQETLIPSDNPDWQVCPNTFSHTLQIVCGSLGISAWDFCMQETKRKQAYVFSAILTRAS